MANEKRSHDWGQTSAQLALLANINRDPKKRSRPFHPDDFNPYAERRLKRGGIPITKANRKVLQKMFAKKH